ncbi:hypothetical protein Ndes2437B_g07106 [Nannochloris sp. 'desiccata']
MMMKTPLKTASKAAMGRTPIRPSPLARFTPGRMRPTPGRKWRSSIIKVMIPLALISIVLATKPNFSAHHLPEREDDLLSGDQLEFVTSSQKGGGAEAEAVAVEGSLDGRGADGLLGQQQQQQQQQQIQEEEKVVTATPVDFDSALQQLSYCETFECIKQAHTVLAGRSRFNFPHFFLIGWQKCATTSVNLNLRSHPEYLPSPVKESHYFTTCQHFWNHTNCMAHNTSHYIHEFLRLEDAVQSKLERVSVDASVDYAWKGGSIAPELYNLFPWIKLVVIMREPLSRLISYVRMYTQREHEIKGCLAGRSMFDCLQYHLDPKEANSNYSVPLESWFQYFPASQFHIIQFEELQEDPASVMRRLKEFLGMDPNLPKKELKNTNLRKSGGYKMTIEEYRRLLEQVRWDSERIASMVSEQGLGDKTKWLGRPGLLPFSSQNKEQNTKKVAASPAKVIIKATLDPDPPSPLPTPEKSSSSSSIEKDAKEQRTTSPVTELYPSNSSRSDNDKSLTTTTSTTLPTSTAASTEPTSNDGDDYNDEEDYDYFDDYKNDTIDNEDNSEDSDNENNPLMSPNMGAALSKQMVLNSNLTDPKLRATLFALSKCRNYECIKRLHYEIDGRTRFNFPHFFLIGWQKCATTSFLRIQDAALGGLERATIDASVDYAWKGRSLSKEIHDLFPWLKIVMMMREPISRMISYTRMFTIKDVRGKGCMPPKTIYGCLSKGLSRESAVYANALEAWLETFPAEQVHVIQFEELQENDQRVLHDLKVFLGMDTQLPVQEDLRNVNSRRSGGGYPLTLEEYQSLIALVRPGAERVAKLLGDKGIKNEKEWMGRWEFVWNKVIEESCDADGQCEVNSNR